MVDPPIVTHIGAISDGAIVGDKCTFTALACAEVFGITPDEGDWSYFLPSIGIESFLLVGALLPFCPLPLGMSAVANLVILVVFLIAPYDAINACM